jgi:hypothetical protein
MQAAQAMALEVEAADLRPVVHGADASRGQHGQEIGREIAGAEAIDRDIHQYAALGRRHRAPATSWPISSSAKM